MVNSPAVADSTPWNPQDGDFVATASGIAARPKHSRTSHCGGDLQSQGAALKRMDSILIRATNWIGDAIISLPAVKELRRLYPRARISILAKPWVADVYRAVQVADEVILFDRAAHPGVAGVFQIARQLRERHFQSAVLLQNAFEAAAIAYLARIPVRIGYDTDCRGLLLTDAVRVPKQFKTRHQSYYYLHLLQASGLSSASYAPEEGYQPDALLELSEAQTIQALRSLQSLGISRERPLIGLNPGAAFGPAKRWFPDRYAAVADHLIGRWGAQVVVFGTPAEREIASEIQRCMRQPPLILSGQTSLMELMGMIACCDLFITNDSGPMHLAAALQRPLIALFGSTDENATGPMSRAAHVIHKPVDCTPCFRRTCPIDLRCFDQIRVPEVCALADEILQARSLDRVEVN